MQEAYPFTVEAEGPGQGQMGLHLRSAPRVPTANEPLEVLTPTKEQNPCSL